ncbi:hypothetical protein PVK06_035684 [Gossypium arboreum]|uniref:Uncharacterized protein n=1 Tax=Gossypium arboreum TaxID=29729 RepID=A0ABR0NHH2_GOSAR|nr:hypothetical protein PVK06_035684 [Gossypium arboreum]
MSEQESHEREFQPKSKGIQQLLDQLEEFFQKRSQASTALGEVIHDASNFDPKGQCITVSHPKLNLESQQEFGSGDGNEPDTTEDIFDPINIKYMKT